MNWCSRGTERKHPTPGQVGARFCWNEIRVVVIDLLVILLHCSISIVAVICYTGLVWNYMQYIRTPVRFHRVPAGNVHCERVSRDVGGVVPRRSTWE